MKKYITGAMMALALLCSVANDTYARTPQDDKLVKEMSGGLPVYMGNGMTWKTFDIDNNGQIIIGLLSNNLPAVDAMTPELTKQYKDALAGPESGYAKLSKQLNRPLIVNIYNAANDLCVTAKIDPQAPQK
ncbi:MAG: hypothetical protein K2J23_06140 [Muribaculaceae bacterium]|nr:hypothetical protein [Muribaculaceae bacterium]MDE6866958.1 hypothetical protein [Muribaculaceae bacterium]